MLSDKRIFESEVTFCRNVAIKLGFNKSVVDFLQSEIYKHPKDKLKQMMFEEYTSFSQ